MTDIAVADVDGLTKNGRTILPDLIRAWAIIGIVLVNVAVFSYPSDAGYLMGGFKEPIDRYADSAVMALFAFKSYALFSFMFGAGLGFQMQSAERRGKAFGPRYARRIIGLLLLGILHFTFFFVGDILITYAVLGALLYFCRNMAPKKAIKIGIILLLIQAALFGIAALAIWAMTIFAPGELPGMDEMQVSIDAELAGMTSEGFFEVAKFRLSQLYFVPMIVLFQGISVFGYFLIGLGAVKNGVINDPSAPIWRKLRWFALPIGLIGNIYAAWVMSSAESFLDPHMMTGMALIGLFSPLSAFGYAGLIAGYARGPVTPIKQFLARGGSATLTAYLMQSMILAYVFSGYGLGLYAQLGASVCIAIALATGLFTLLFSSLWRRAFDRGPMEYLLRGWTYLGRN